MYKFFPVCFFLFFASLVYSQGQEILFNPYEKYHEYHYIEDHIELPGGNIICRGEHVNILNDDISYIFEDYDSLASEVYKIGSDFEEKNSFGVPVVNTDDLNAVTQVFPYENSKLLARGGSFIHTGGWPGLNYNWHLILNHEFEILEEYEFPIDTASLLGGTPSLLNSDNEIMRAGTFYSNDPNINTGIESISIDGEVTLSNYTLPFEQDNSDALRRAIVLEFNEPREYHVVFDDEVALLDSSLNLTGSINYSELPDRIVAAAHVQDSDTYFFGGFFCKSIPGDFTTPDTCFDYVTRVIRGEPQSRLFRYNATPIDEVGVDAKLNRKGDMEARYSGYNYITNTAYHWGQENFINLTCFDDDGEVRWSKKLVNTLPDRMYCKDIIATRDTGVVVIARCFSEDAEIKGSYYVRFDKDGNQVDYLANLEDNLTNFSDDRLNVYPNPTRDFLMLGGLNVPRAHFEIFDLTGRLVQSGSYTEGETLNVGNLPVGMYTLRVHAENQMTFRSAKFIINRE